jgi:DUF218 domain
MEKAYLLLLNGLSSPQRLSSNSLIRLEKLVSVWDRTSCIIVSTGFTRYKPPFLDSRGYPVTESRVAARALLDRGVQRSKIFIEEASSDTIGNIYFAMLLFVQPLNIQALSIVTSAFHVARVQAVAEWICSLSGWRTIPNLAFETAPDPEMSRELEELVTAKEVEDLRNVLRLRQAIRSVSEICLWLQFEHKAYRFDAQVDSLPPAILHLY